MSSPDALLSPAEERFERWRGRIGLVAGPVLFVGVLLLPIPSLPPPAHRTLAIAALVCTWWLSEALPMAATALLGPALCVLLGIAPARDALRPFSDPVIFLFLGGFLLAEAMVKHGLNRRIALSVMALPQIGGSLTRLYIGLAFLTAFLSAWVSNTATAAMMLPIAVSILQEFARTDPAGGRTPTDWRRNEHACGLVLVTAFSASIGGLATPIGTPPNLIGLGLIERAMHTRPTFFAWMYFALPATLVLTGLLVWKLRRNAPRNDAWSTRGASWARAEADRLGPWSRPERQVAAVFSLAVTFWILPGLAAITLGPDAPAVRWMNSHLPEGVVALLAAILLFMLPAGGPAGGRNLVWSDAARVDWGTILLFGGGMALGEVMFDTGLAVWIGEHATAALPFRSTVSLTILFAVVGLLVSEATSNTASATMIVPLALAMAQSAGVDPLRPALGACLGCSLGFMLPVSTPPNALAYGTGAVPLTRMIRHGLWLDLVGAVVVVACVIGLAP